MAHSLDVDKLEQEVKAVYRDVAQTPDGEFHFEMGRPLAERLGYPPGDLDQIPQDAIDSFAGSGTTSTWPTSRRATTSSISAVARGWTCSSRHYTSAKPAA